MIATINLIRSSSAVASDNNAKRHGANYLAQAYRLNQPTPPLEHRRVVVPYRAQSCRQASNEVLFLLGFPQTHDVADGVKHLVQERVLQCIVGLAVHNADRLGFWVAETDRTRACHLRIVKEQHREGKTALA